MAERDRLLLAAFSPAANGRMTFGHGLCAYANWAKSRAEGIILRSEDTNIMGNSYLTRERYEMFMQSFRDGLKAIGVPVIMEVKQSERLWRYEELSQKAFGMILGWETEPIWTKVEYLAPQPFGFNMHSPFMAYLSRVADYHDFGITNVVRGTELAWSALLDAFLWRVLFPEVALRERTAYGYVRELMTPSEGKVSKSVSRDYFLDDYPGYPFGVMVKIVENQMVPNTVSGPLQPKNPLELRNWMAVADQKPEPPPVTKEQLIEWS